VYADLGGVLVVAPDGAVVRFDPEADKVSTVQDECWRTLALLRAARTFPELASLRPVRAASAMTCRSCDGQGAVVGSIDCGECFGLVDFNRGSC
jgi:hypothetical protein